MSHHPECCCHLPLLNIDTRLTGLHPPWSSTNHWQRVRLQQLVPALVYNNACRGWQGDYGWITGVFLHVFNIKDRILNAFILTNFLMSHRGRWKFKMAMRFPVCFFRMFVKNAIRMQSTVFSRKKIILVKQLWHWQGPLHLKTINDEHHSVAVLTSLKSLRITRIGNGSSSMECLTLQQVKNCKDMICVVFPCHMLWTDPQTKLSSNLLAMSQ